MTKFPFLNSGSISISYFLVLDLKHPYKFLRQFNAQCDSEVYFVRPSVCLWPMCLDVRIPVCSIDG